MPAGQQQGLEGPGGPVGHHHQPVLVLHHQPLLRDTELQGATWGRGHPTAGDNGTRATSSPCGEPPARHTPAAWARRAAPGTAAVSAPPGAPRWGGSCWPTPGRDMGDAVTCPQRACSITPLTDPKISPRGTLGSRLPPEKNPNPAHPQVRAATRWAARRVAARDGPQRRGDRMGTGWGAPHCREDSRSHIPGVWCRRVNAVGAASPGSAGAGWSSPSSPPCSRRSAGGGEQGTHASTHVPAGSHLGVPGTPG